MSRTPLSLCGTLHCSSPTSTTFLSSIMTSLKHLSTFRIMLRKFPPFVNMLMNCIVFVLISALSITHLLTPDYVHHYLFSTLSVLTHLNCCHASTSPSSIELQL